MKLTSEEPLSAAPEVAQVAPVAQVLTESQTVQSDRMRGQIAQKDFIICQNDFRADIKKGDNLDAIPDIYFQNLKTEKVI